ncbi:hypothetical protein GGS23DRAFT_200880 [Durotheca rogersii]|uniref:uncharacterized protein n=1 Tax=Durotheca rogersii TaxID=419775 RepID=UPI00221FE1B0|nr:uncharacterized protein GGS23DRAFT_200880 [Durotheca rogersii]KAI5867853.1 hypothetical protein GGS23DRAFT_200880 [Durotheca rogersii]
MRGCAPGWGEGSSNLLHFLPLRRLFFSYFSLPPSVSVVFLFLCLHSSGVAAHLLCFFPLIFLWSPPDLTVLSMKGGWRKCIRYVAALNWGYLPTGFDEIMLTSGVTPPAPRSLSVMMPPTMLLIPNPSILSLSPPPFTHTGFPGLPPPSSVPVIGRAHIGTVNLAERGGGGGKARAGPQRRYTLRCYIAHPTVPDLISLLGFLVCLLVSLEID